MLLGERLLRFVIAPSFDVALLLMTLQEALLLTAELDVNLVSVPAEPQPLQVAGQVPPSVDLQTGVPSA